MASRVAPLPERRRGLCSQGMLVRERRYSFGPSGRFAPARHAMMRACPEGRRSAWELACPVQPALSSGMEQAARRRRDCHHSDGWSCGQIDRGPKFLRAEGVEDFADALPQIFIQSLRRIPPGQILRERRRPHVTMRKIRIDRIEPLTPLGLKRQRHNGHEGPVPYPELYPHVL